MLVECIALEHFPLMLVRGISPSSAAVSSPLEVLKVNANPGLNEPVNLARD